MACSRCQNSETEKPCMASLRVKSPETSPEACLETILHEAGSGFEVGVVGASAFHLLKGLCRSPNGSRLAGTCQAVRLNAPRVGGKFAAWYALSTAFEYAFRFARRRDDPWNGIASPAAASGLLSVHRGLGASARFATLTGALFALPVVGLIWITKLEADFEDERARKSGST